MDMQTALMQIDGHVRFALAHEDQQKEQSLRIISGVAQKALLGQLEAEIAMLRAENQQLRERLSVQA